MKLIDKDDLAAKLEDRRDKIKKYACIARLQGRQLADATFEYEILGNVRDFLDTLEVKEINFEKEYNNFVKDDIVYNKLINIVSRSIAKHFFELSLKAQKGE